MRAGAIVMRVVMPLLGIAALLAGAAGGVSADTVEMRDGTLVQGKYVGGTAGTIRMESPEGVKVIETAKVLALTFSVGGAATTAPTAAAPGAPSAVPAAAA